MAALRSWHVLCWRLRSFSLWQHLTVFVLTFGHWWWSTTSTSSRLRASTCAGGAFSTLWSSLSSWSSPLRSTSKTALFAPTTASNAQRRALRRSRATARRLWYLHKRGVIKLHYEKLQNIFRTLRVHHSKDVNFLHSIAEAMTENTPWKCMHCKQLRKHTAAFCPVCQLPWQQAMDRTYVHISGRQPQQGTGWNYDQSNWGPSQQWNRARQPSRSQTPKSRRRSNSAKTPKGQRKGQGKGRGGGMGKGKGAMTPLPPPQIPWPGYAMHGLPVPPMPTLPPPQMMPVPSPWHNTDRLQLACNAAATGPAEHHIDSISCTEPRGEGAGRDDQDKADGAATRYEDESSKLCQEGRCQGNERLAYCRPTTGTCETRPGGCLTSSLQLDRILENLPYRCNSYVAGIRDALSTAREGRPNKDTGSAGPVQPGQCPVGTVPDGCRQSQNHGDQGRGRRDCGGASHNLERFRQDPRQFQDALNLPTSTSSSNRADRDRHASCEETTTEYALCGRSIHGAHGGRPRPHRKGRLLLRPVEHDLWVWQPGALSSLGVASHISPDYEVDSSQELPSPLSEWMAGKRERDWSCTLTTRTFDPYVINYQFDFEELYRDSEKFNNKEDKTNLFFVPGWSLDRQLRHAGDVQHHRSRALFGMWSFAMEHYPAWSWPHPSQTRSSGSTPSTSTRRACGIQSDDHTQRAHKPSGTSALVSPKFGISWMRTVKLKTMRKARLSMSTHSTSAMPTISSRIRAGHWDSIDNLSRGLTTLAKSGVTFSTDRPPFLLSLVTPETCIHYDERHSWHPSDCTTSYSIENCSSHDFNWAKSTSCQHCPDCPFLWRCDPLQTCSSPRTSFWSMWHTSTSRTWTMFDPHWQSWTALWAPNQASWRTWPHYPNSTTSAAGAMGDTTCGQTSCSLSTTRPMGLGRRWCCQLDDAKGHSSQVHWKRNWQWVQSFWLVPHAINNGLFFKFQFPKLTRRPLAWSPSFSSRWEDSHGLYPQSDRSYCPSSYCGCFQSPTWWHSASSQTSIHARGFGRPPDGCLFGTTGSGWTHCAHPPPHAGRRGDLSSWRIPTSHLH